MTNTCAAGDQPEHLGLAVGQTGKVDGRLGTVTSGLLDQSACHARREQTAALGDDSDRGGQPLLGGVLEEERAGSGTKGVAVLATGGIVLGVAARRTRRRAVATAAVASGGLALIGHVAIYMLDWMATNNIAGM